MARLHKHVDSIEEQVAGMADLASHMLRTGVRALGDLDRDAAHTVIAREDELAQLDEDIETYILRTFALEEPVAGDLRRIGTALKLITYINRVGRYGYDIARVAANWPEGEAHVARMVSLPGMADKVEAMLVIAMTTFRAHAVPDVAAVRTLEQDVDALRYSVWRECLTYMAESPSNIERCAHYMMVARYLERCGDNICKMVEKLHWSATGERLLLN